MYLGWVRASLALAIFFSSTSPGDIALRFTDGSYGVLTVSKSKDVYYVFYKDCKDTSFPLTWKTCVNQKYSWETYAVYYDRLFTLYKVPREYRSNNGKPLLKRSMDENRRQLARNPTESESKRIEAEYDRLAAIHKALEEIQNKGFLTDLLPSRRRSYDYNKDPRGFASVYLPMNPRWKPPKPKGEPKEPEDKPEQSRKDISPLPKIDPGLLLPPRKRIKFIELPDLIPGKMNENRWEKVTIPPDKTMRITRTGAVFVRDTSHPKLGEAWRDPSGMIWGDAALKNGKVQDMSPLQAQAYCESIGAHLPKVEDFKRLADYLGYGRFQDYKYSRWSNSGNPVLPHLGFTEIIKEEHRDTVYAIGFYFWAASETTCPLPWPSWPFPIAYAFDSRYGDSRCEVYMEGAQRRNPWFSARCVMR